MGKTNLKTMIVIAIGLPFHCGCDVSQVFAPSAPVKISWRGSALDNSGLVLQVHNTSGHRLSCQLVASNKTLNQATKHAFDLGPYATTELGLLEASWSFKSNEQVRIEVEGFNTLSFKVP